MAAFNDEKINIAAFPWETAERKWQAGDWYWESRDRPVPEDLEAMRNTWQAAAPAFAARERAAAALEDAERRLAAGPISGIRDAGVAPTALNDGLDAITYTAELASEPFDLAAYLLQLLHVKRMRRSLGFKRKLHKIIREDQLHLTWRARTRAWRVALGGLEGSERKSAAEGERGVSGEWV